MCYVWVFQVAAAAIGAYGQIQQGQAQYQADMMNAQIQERNIQQAENEQTLVKDNAAIERRRLGERVRAERGELNAKFTAMGLDPGFGTPADLVGDVEQAYSIDRSILGRNEITELQRLDMEIADRTDAASMLRSSGKSALTSSSYAAAGSLMDGVGSVSSRWITPKPTTTTTSAANSNLPPPTIPRLKVGGG